MSRASAEERALIRRAIEHGETERLAEIVDIVRRTGALAATREAAYAEAEKARELLSGLPETPAREALLDLCVRSVERSS
jgi:octaprenyl-diphosphate synthase